MKNIELVNSFNISFRKLTQTKKDYELLYNWCKNKYVYEWFEQRSLSYEEIVNKYKNKIDNKKQDLYIIQANSKDIGLVQIYKFENDIKINDLDSFQNIYEYDLFIGEEEYLNKGIGKKIVNEINDLIYKKYNADSIILRPFKRNKRAVNCYKKCNYEIFYEYESTDTIGNKETIIVLLNKLNRWTFGIDIEILINLVLDGKKTATTSLYELDSVPEVGELSVLTDSFNNNVCLLKTNKVIITEFKNITWNLAKLEGEDNSLNEWKEKHIEYFNKLDSNFNENTKVIFEIFEVIKKWK